MVGQTIRRIRPAVKRHWQAAILVALFGLIYSGSLHSYGMFRWDEAEYASIARSVAAGQGFAISEIPNPLRPPILPLAGAFSMLLTGEQDDDTVLRATSVVFALLALLVVYGFAAAAFDRTAGFAAAALLGLSPLFWTWVPCFMCEIPFMAFFAAAVWSFHFGAYRDERFFFWSWIFWALAFLTRYTASLFLPVLVVFVPLAIRWGGSDTRRRFRSRSFLLSPLAGLAVLSPWLLREYMTFGDPLAGLRNASQQLQVYEPGVTMTWHFYFDGLPQMLSPAIVILLVAGAVLAVWKAERFTVHSLLTATVILVWFSCYRYKESRLASSALPFLAVVAAMGLKELAATLRPRMRAPAVAVALAAVFALNFRAVRPVLESSLVLGYPSFPEAMLFLREHASPGAVVVGANYPQIHWYSGLRAIDFPDESELPETLRHCEWVVITNFERGQRPYVSQMANRLAGAPPDSLAQFRDSQFATMIVRPNLLLPAAP